MIQVSDFLSILFASNFPLLQMVTTHRVKKLVIPKASKNCSLFKAAKASILYVYILCFKNTMFLTSCRTFQKNYVDLLSLCTVSRLLHYDLVSEKTSFVKKNQSFKKAGISEHNLKDSFESL